MQIRVFLILLISIIGLIGCKDKKPPVNNQSIEDSLGIQYTDHIVPINNDYTKIKNSFCDHVEFSDLIYTNANTKIYSLDQVDTTRRFIFMTEVECGYPAGNCGASIDLIIRKKNKYESQLKVCGTLDTVNLYDNYFEYTTFTNRKLRVDFSNNTHKIQVISINGMPYQDLNKITTELDLLEGDLIKAGDKTENMDAIVVNHKEQTLTADLTLHVYELTKDNEPYQFVFLHKGMQQVQQLGGKGRLKIKEFSNQTEIVFTNQQKTEKWQFNNQKKLFSLLK